MELFMSQYASKENPFHGRREFHWARQKLSYVLNGKAVGKAG